MLFKLPLVLKDMIMHFPVFTLCTSSFSCLRCHLGMWVNASDWKMAKNVAQPFSQTPAKSLYDWMYLPAVNALQVTIFDQGDACIFWTHGVVTVSNR